MNYCLRYTNSSKIMIKEAEEISIIYDKNDTALPAFIEKHDTKRINLIIENPEESLDAFEIKKLNAINEKYHYSVIYVCLYSNKRCEAMSDNLLALMADLKMPWFTGNMITTWDALHYFISLGVTDVYIAEDLGFEISLVYDVCHKANVKVRVIPNVAQSNINQTPDLKKFFIRPEDMELYSKYIDTVEFWGELRQQDVFYKIYKGGKWYGNLKEIIFSFNEDLDSHRVLPVFGNARLGCDKRCLKGFNCSICESIKSIQEQMKEQNLIIKNRH